MSCAGLSPTRLPAPSTDWRVWRPPRSARRRHWSGQEIDLLREIGRSVVTELEASRLRGEVSRGAEEARRQVREKTALLDGIPHGLFLVAPDGRILLVNRAAAHFFQGVSGRS